MLVVVVRFLSKCYSTSFDDVNRKAMSNLEVKAMVELKVMSLLTPYPNY